MFSKPPTLSCRTGLWSTHLCSLPRLRVTLQGPRVHLSPRGAGHAVYIMGRPAAEKQEGSHMWELWAPLGLGPC